MPSRYDTPRLESVSTDTPSAFGLALVQAAGGDPSVVASLQQMAWDQYLAAGAPEGVSEEGMRAWWSGRIEAAQA